ncbi:MAG: acyl-CoA thioesterase [Actinobacteria bacterium]|uniref:Unannotated protein n=1 Tax=freshwater metagenome TaxID=449393 RepID=A0A6J6NU43_9ZZZZ|nr:acyl-CoA thioesterase [Actinomycetota bacterium]
MRHVYECPMRWADLDQLGHVNNVVYADYLQEARADMLRALGAPERAADPADGLVVVRHQMTYLEPLLFEFKPVLIECWVTEIRAASFTMAYEIFHLDDRGERRVYLRASTVLTPFVFTEERPRRITDHERALLERFLEPAERAVPWRRTPVAPSKVGHYPVQVRFSDVDVFGHVNNVKYLEYFQEARILTTSRLYRDLIAAGARHPHSVIAQVDVEYHVPLRFRGEPYDLWSRIAHVGTRSMTIESEIVDGDQLMARSRVVIVFYDLAANRSTEPAPAIRSALVEAMG